MTTTAHEDQFTSEPEPVRQQYSTADILRRNVADLELALKQQTERAEKAEEELKELREQVPLTFVHDPNGYAIGGTHTEIADALPVGTDLYTRPIPAPAVPAAPEHCKDCGMRWTDTTAHANMCVAEMLRQDTKQALAVPMQRNLPGDRCEVCGAAGSADGASSTHCAPKPEFVFGRVVVGNYLSTKSVTVTIGGGVSGAGCAGGAGGAGVGAGTGSTAVFSGAALVSGTDNAANGTGKPAVAVPAVPEDWREAAQQLIDAASVMLDAQPFITAETYGGRYIVAMRFERLDKMQDCHAALLALLRSAEVTK